MFIVVLPFVWGFKLCLCKQYTKISISIKCPKMGSEVHVHNAVHNVNSLHHNNIGR